MHRLYTFIILFLSFSFLKRFDAPTPKRVAAVPVSLLSIAISASNFFMGEIKKPSAHVIPALSAVFTPFIPSIVQGVSSGESVYSLLHPLLMVVENFARQSSFVEGIVRTFVLKQNLIFPGVHLPNQYSESVSNFLTLTGTSQLVIVQFLASTVTRIGSIVGMSKDDEKSVKAFNDLHGEFVDFAIKKQGPFATSNTLPEDYMYFGNGSNYANLPFFLRTNPFFTASLNSVSDKSFEIDPFGKSDMAELISCLHDSVPRVAATFDLQMNLKTIKVYNASDPKIELTNYNKEEAATALLYQCSYYAQNIHATTHVRHISNMLC